MKLNDLRPAEGSKKSKKRVGRGTGSGSGKTSGRGMKGQSARSGGAKGPYFEGGQLPISKRLPHKRGFNNIFKIQYTVINLDRLAEFPENTRVDPEALVGAGIIRSARRPIKVLGQGEIGHALTVVAHKFSASARSKIESAGGSVVEIGAAE